MSSSNDFNYSLVRAFNIQPSAAQTPSPLFTSAPLKHPEVSSRTGSNTNYGASIITLPTKFSRAQVFLPVSPPVPQRRAPRPPVKYVPRNHFRSNHLLSPLHEPGRKGLWTVSEDEHGEREAEMEETIRKTQSAAFEEALMRWQAENEDEEEQARPSSVVDSFVDIDLYENNAFSCSTSCTSEDASHCVTPSTEIENPLEDVFFVPAAASERASTYSFETIGAEVHGDLFFVPSGSSRKKPQVNALDFSGNHSRSDSWEFDYALTPRTPNMQRPDSPTSSEESFGSRLSPSRALFNPSTAFADASKRPPPLDLKNSLAWRVSLEPNLPVLGSPFSPSPAPARSHSQREDGPSGLMSPISLDVTTPKNAISFSMTTPPPLSRSSRSSSLSSTASSAQEQPITPSPLQGNAGDMLSSTFADFLISTEEDPSPYTAIALSVGMDSPAHSKEEMRFPLPPFRLNGDMPRTPVRSDNNETIRAPGAPARQPHRAGPPPPSSSALQRAMGMQTRPNDRTHDTTQRRSKPSTTIPKSSGALQMATGMISPALTTRSNKSSSSSSSISSSASSSSSTSRRSLPQRKPLPMDWIGYHPKETGYDNQHPFPTSPLRWNPEHDHTRQTPHKKSRPTDNPTTY